MVELGKLLLVLGGTILVIGVVLLFAGRTHLPLGRFPGDFVYRGKNTVFYFPLVTCLLLSVVISLILWLLNRR
jgi:ribose/xylose/arabinose/galactoside ABC-type transport system permease subunit